MAKRKQEGASATDAPVEVPPTIADTSPPEGQVEEVEETSEEAAASAASDGVEGSAGAYVVSLLAADLSCTILTDDPDGGGTDVALYDTVEEARAAGLKAGVGAHLGCRVLVSKIVGAYGVGLVDLDTREVVQV